MQKKNGISLIVLVITIIVMTILATVVIISLNNSGIIGKASKVVDDTNIAEIDTMANVAWGEAYLKYNGKGTKEQLEQEVNSKLTQAGIDLDKYTVKVTTKGVNTAIKGSAKDVKLNLETMYGATVTNYYPTLDVDGDGDSTNDWKIFYATENNIYLIAANYTKNSLVDTSLTGLGLRGNYRVFWDEVPDAQEFNNVDYMTSGYSLADHTSNTNTKYITTLLNTANWDTFKNNRYADSAIGGPTIEMFAASWNEKYKNNFADENSNIHEIVLNTNDNGYYLGDSSATSDEYEIDSRDEKDILYFLPNKLDSAPISGYLLSSPKGRYVNSLINATKNGVIDGGGIAGGSASLRPVVMLNSGIKVELNAANTGYELVGSKVN